MAAGYLLLGIQPVFVKLTIDHGFTSAETVAMRFALALLLVLPLAALSRQSLRSQQPVVWLLRGLLGGLAVLLYFESVRRVGAGLGTLLNYTYPIWANLLSFVIGERPSRSVWLALALAIFGTVLVVQPSFTGGIGTGELCGLTSAVLAGGAIVCIKRLRRTDGELTIIASFSLVGLLLTLPLLPLLQPGSAVEVSPGAPPSAWAFAFLVGLLSFYGHVYFTRGYKETTIQLGTVLSLLVPTLAVLSGWLVLDERLAPEALTGAGLIASGVLLVATRERLGNRRSPSPA
jgi:drug/metabolite transporter (DMT)-like permease